MAKRWLYLLLAATLLVSFCGCDDRAGKTEIFVFVQTHENALLQAIEHEDFSSLENRDVVKSIYPDEQCVDFSCGGAGFGPATSYVGFFYTPEHDMGAVWCGCDAALLVPCGVGFEHREGDNRYYVEHICGNFYYYEASY